MKKYYKHILRTFMLFTLIFVSSCDADDDAFTNVSIGDSDVESAYHMDNVTLTGSNFDQVQFVFVGNQQATFQLDGDQLTFQVPERAPVGETTITLAMANNQRVIMPFVVVRRPNPVIEKISPTAAASGQTVRIQGINLDNLESVTVAGIEATVSDVSTANELVFTVPDGLPNNTQAEIVVSTAGGEATSSSIFYVGQNLLANGEFEQGDGDNFTNWNKYNGADRLTATTDASVAYYGRSLRAQGAGGNPWDTQFASDAAPTTVGVEYTLNMWIRATEGAPGSIRFSTSPNAMYSGDYEITSEWQQIEWVFTANADATIILLDLGRSNATYIIDNVTLVATGQAGPQPVQLLENGGFEQGDGDDFVFWNKFNGADLLTATTNDDAVRSGSRALRAVGAGADAWRTQLASDEMPTVPGTEYHMSMWVKGAAGTPGVGGSIRVSTASPTGSAQYGPDMTVTNEWQQYEWSFVANDNVTRVVLDLGATADAVYFIDDVSFEAPPAQPAQDIAVNGGFEEGDGDEFTGWNKFNGADLLTATTNEDEVRSGSRALRAEGAGGDAWRTQLASDELPTVPDQEYTVTMWVKGAAGTPGVGGVIRVSTQSPTGAAQYGPDMTVTDDWQQYEYTFTANDTATNIVLDLGLTAGAVYFIDDLKVMDE